MRCLVRLDLKNSLFLFIALTSVFLPGCSEPIYSPTGTPTAQMGQETHGGNSIRGEFITIGSFSARDFLKGKDQALIQEVLVREELAFENKTLSWKTMREPKGQRKADEKQSSDKDAFKAVHDKLAFKKAFRRLTLAYHQARINDDYSYFNRPLKEILEFYLHWIKVDKSLYSLDDWKPSGELIKSLKPNFHPSIALTSVSYLLEPLMNEQSRPHVKGLWQDLFYYFRYSLAPLLKSFSFETLDMSFFFMKETLKPHYPRRAPLDKTKQLHNLFYSSKDNTVKVSFPALTGCLRFEAFLNEPAVLATVERVLKELEFKAVNNQIYLFPHAKNYKVPLDAIYTYDGKKFRYQYNPMTTLSGGGGPSGFVRLFRHEILHSVVDLLKQQFGPHLWINGYGYQRIESFRDTHNKFTRCFGNHFFTERSAVGIELNP